MNEQPNELVKFEYRVKKVDRYIVTKYEEWSDGMKGSNQMGEFDNPDMAWEVGYALCKQMHGVVGWPLDDERIQYPRHPNAVDGVRVVSPVVE